MTRISAILLALCAIAFPAWGHEAKVGALELIHPFARATTPAIKTGAAYMTIRNNGQTADRLISASTPASASVMLHANIKDGAVMRMRHVDAIDLAPGASLVLSPAGAFHLMLIDLKAPLKAGTSFPLTLVFERAGKVDLTIEVEAPGSSGAHGG